MHNTAPEPGKTTPPVTVTAILYPSGYHFPRHTHQYGQFAFAATGCISVMTPAGHWLVPPMRACWVPAGVEHEMLMMGEVTMQNGFIPPELAQQLGLPDHCEVMVVSPLLQRLLQAAVDIPDEYVEVSRDGKLMALLVEEIAAMPAIPLFMPLPQDSRLQQVSRYLLEFPSLSVQLDEAAAMAGMSRRSFTRLFRAQTGYSFAKWRQQACLLSAIRRLCDGESVTRVALDLGYGSTAAFSAAFHQVMGASPTQYAVAAMS